MRRYLSLSLGVLAWVALDQWTKVLAVKKLVLPDGVLPDNADHIRTDIVPVTETWFNLRLDGNTGAAFSLFGDLSPTMRGLFFGVVTVVAVVAIVYFYAHTELKLQKSAYILLLGGAIGNAIDRLRLGYVVDMIQWYYRDFVWPTFNIADVGICAGIGLLIIDAVVNRKHHAEMARQAEEAKAARASS